MGKMRTDKILVIDLEATCWENGIAPNGKTQREESEIIEIGVQEISKDNLGNYYGSSNYTFYVAPKKHKISDYCEKLTGISQKFIDENGMSLDIALGQFNKTYSPKYKTIVGWGNYDKQQIIKECKEKNILHRYKFSDTYINLKNIFALKYNLDKEVGLNKALQHLNMEFIGDQHRGICDAMNTGRLFLEIIK